MTETTADVQTIVRRLGLLEEQLQELQSLLSSHVPRGPAGAATEHPYVTRVDAILGGEPIIKGTRTPVRAVAEHWKFGDAPEEIARKLPHLHLAQIFDALSYYDDHRDEIEGYIALNRVPLDDRARRERRLGGLGDSWLGRGRTALSSASASPSAMASRSPMATGR